MIVKTVPANGLRAYWAFALSSMFRVLVRAAPPPPMRSFVQYIFLYLPEEIEKYIEQNSSSEEEVLRELTRETYLKVQMPNMLSGHLQGQFLQSFTSALQPKRIL